MDQIDVTKLSPPNLEWHYMYARGMKDISELLHKLEYHDAFGDGEDLRDYVEALSTLISFHPRTDKQIEIEVGGRAPDGN